MGLVIFTVCFAAGVYLLLWVVLLRSKRDTSEESAHFQKILEQNELGSDPQLTRTKSERESLNERLSDELRESSLLQQEDGKQFMERLDYWLLMGGIRDKYTPETALARAITIWVGGIILGIFVYLVGMPPFLAGAVILYAMAYPPLKLKGLIAARQDAIKAEVPFFIGELYMAISSGMTTIDDAINRVAKTSSEDNVGDSILSQEFALATAEYRVGGLSQETALRRVGYRTGVIAVQNLVEALIQGLRTGTAMQDVLIEYMSTAQEIWRQDMRTYQKKKMPMVTMGLIITMFGALIIWGTPLLIEFSRALSGLSG